MRDRTITGWLLIGGVIGPVLFVVVFLMEGATRPGYDPMRMFVSLLSLSDLGWQQIANFLSSDRQSVSRYAAAALHWEYFLGQSWHAYLLLRGLFKFLTQLDVPQVFVRGEGSVEERLNDLYNQMKHVDSRIENGKMIEGPRFPSGSRTKASEALTRCSRTQRRVMSSGISRSGRTSSSTRARWRESCGSSVPAAEVNSRFCGWRLSPERPHRAATRGAGSSA